MTKNKEYYLTDTLAYDKFVSVIIPQSNLFFSNCLSFIPEGAKKLLELGSGTGYATSKILSKNPELRITCIDHSPDMIAYAKQKTELNQVEILEQEIQDLWPDIEYDVIFTTLCFHHIPEKDRIILLDRICEKLSPNGVFICGDIIRPESYEIEAIYRMRWKKLMIRSGISSDLVDTMIESRRTNYTGMESVVSFYQKMKTAGFSNVLMPYKSDISVIFVGY